MSDSVAILLGAIFVNNFVTVQFLGLCPFLGTSRNFEGALGMGAPPRFACHPARRSLRFRCAGRRVPRARGARLRARLLSLSRGAARVAGRVRLIELAGWTEAQYREFVRVARGKSRIQPGTPVAALAPGRSRCAHCPVRSHRSHHARHVPSCRAWTRHAACRKAPHP